MVLTWVGRLDVDLVMLLAGMMVVMKADWLDNMSVKALALLLASMLEIL